jgi:hypothetical protein
MRSGPYARATSRSGRKQRVPRRNLAISGPRFLLIRGIHESVGLHARMRCMETMTCLTPSTLRAPQFRFGSKVHYSPSLRTGGAPSQRLSPARGRSGNCLSEHWPTIDPARDRVPVTLDNNNSRQHKNAPPKQRGKSGKFQRWKRYTSARHRAIIIAPANTAAASFLSPPADMRGSAAPLTVRRITGHV